MNFITLTKITAIPVMMALVAISLLSAPLSAGAQYEKLTDAQRAGTAKGDVVGAVEGIIGFIAGLLAVIAMLMIITAGVMYMTSAGDTGRIDTAKRWLTWAIIGLVVALIAWVTVNALSDALGAG